MSQELYELPEGWEWQSFGDVAHTTSGGTPKRTEKSYWGGDIPWIKSGELGDSFVERNEEFITELGLNKSSAKIFPADSLLIALYGATAGKLGVLKYDAATNQAICCIRSLNDSFIRDYARYFLLRKRKQIIKDSFGGAQPNISQNYIREFKIPLPPLNEQKRIVAKLDALFTRIDTAITHLQQTLELSKALFASALDEMFEQAARDFDTKPIEEIFTITSGDGLTQKQMVKDGCYDVFGGNGVTGRHNKFNRSGTNIVIGRVGAWCGNVRLVEGDIWVTDNAFFIKSYLTGVFEPYLVSALQHLNLRMTANQAAQPVVSYKGIRKLLIPLPPIDTQKKIVAYLDALSACTLTIEKTTQEKTSDLNAFKASLLDAAFKGQL